MPSNYEFRKTAMWAIEDEDTKTQKEKDRLKTEGVAKAYAELMKPTPNYQQKEEIYKRVSYSPPNLMQQSQKLLLLEDEMSGY